MMAPGPEALDDSYPTRPSLLQRLKDTGDTVAWQEFNDVYGPLIRRFALKAGLNEAEAQDAVQETLIAAAKNLKEFRYQPEVCAFKTWLLNLSRWRIIDQQRRRLPASARVGGRDETSMGTSTVDRVPDPAGDELDRLWEEEWHGTLREMALKEVRSRVDASQWQIFDLYALKGWSAGEVARALGVNVGRVYLAKHRVSGLLKKEIARLE